MSGFGTPSTFSFGQPASAAAPATFGGFGTPASTGQGAQPATGFGAPSASGFGGLGSQPVSAFGAPAGTGFGAPSATSLSAPAATGFGGFGTPAATGFGGFGAPAATGFGAPAATGFGAPAATGFGAPAATGFGASAATGFGAPAATGFGSFGSSGTTGFGSSATNGFGGFGATPTTSGFGTSSSGKIAGFGSGPPTSSFGAAPTTGFGAFGAPQTVGDAMSQSGLGAFAGAEIVLDIQLSYAPILDSQTRTPSAEPIAGRPNVANETMCKFDTIMYSPKPAGGNGRPNLNTGSRWEQAERDNPEPEALEATRELGIAALRRRFELQNSECAKYQAHAVVLRGSIEAVDKSSRQMGLRVEALQLKQKQLYNRMLSVVRSVEVLRCQGVPMDSSERRYRERLGRLSAGMRVPHTELQELTAMGGQQERPADVYSDFISEEDVDAICRVLKKQRDGLQHLTDILTKDARDVSIVRQRIKPVPHQVR